MSEGYAYTTISARPGEPTRVTVSFYLDQHSWIAVPGIKNGKPHLNITHGEVSVSIGPSAEQVTAQDALLARTLADKAARYAAEVERLCPADDGSGPAAA
jgi:hypothetical protein